MLRDTNLHTTIRRVCATRGIAPVATLAEPPLTRADFHLAQVDATIRRRWNGRYDHAALDNDGVRIWTQRHLADPQRQFALLIAGQTGSGKTHHAVAAVRAIARNHAQRGLGLNWAAVTHPDLAHQLRPKTDDSHEHALDAYLDADLLVLDDLGATTSTPWMADTRQRLVDHRWTRRKATIYTTNLDSAALRTAVGDRVWSRVGDATHVHLVGPDRRWAA